MTDRHDLVAIPVPAEATISSTQRRHPTDRRRSPTRMLSRYTLFGGRREGGRRAGEQVNIFADRFGQGVFLMATTVLLLNVLDAFFTLYFLGVGGEEVNPIADAMLQFGPMAFLLAKTVGIGLCTIYLVLVKHFRGVSAAFGLVITAYALLLAWHLHLYRLVEI